MAAIQSLLNPAPEQGDNSDSESGHSPRTKHGSPSYVSSPKARKKQKICKDAVVFKPGLIHGECRYPPHQYQDDMLAAQHQQFEVFPIGKIADYPRHIPYNSEKKDFFQKTGRESLEVFQYRFKVPGDDTQYAMLWDYNIGLVRTTPLFKCTGHSKTTPAKMLNRNPGLRDICHSITGGALVAQGYWMPYEAAKAVAATFCWNIRYALTPVFGIDFPAMCTSPDADNFGSMTIDTTIIYRCTVEANKYRELEGRAKPQPPSVPAMPLTPETSIHPRYLKQSRPKALKINTTTYSSDAGSEDSYVMSSRTPDQIYRGVWTPINTPRSVPHHHHSSNRVTSRKRPRSPNSSSGLSSPDLSPKSRRITEVDEGYDGDSSDESTTRVRSDTTRQATPGLPSDEKAAYLLMSLRLQGDGKEQCKGKKRRAST